MKPARLLLALALSLTTAASALAGAKKPAAVSIRFHPEAGAESGSFSQKVTLLQSGRETYMGEIPIVSDREIQSYQAFPARDGTYGAYFKLDDHGRNLLAQHTMSRRGSYVLVFFNGRHVIDLLVDRAVKDGIAVIPSGLTAHDVSLLEMTYPPIGREGEKVKKKPAPKPSAASAQTNASPLTPAQIAALQPSMAPAPAMVRLADGSIVPAKSDSRGGTIMPKPLDHVGHPQ